MLIRIIGWQKQKVCLWMLQRHWCESFGAGHVDLHHTRLSSRNRDEAFRCFRLLFGPSGGAPPGTMEAAGHRFRNSQQKRLTWSPHVKASFLPAGFKLAAHWIHLLSGSSSGFLITASQTFDGLSWPNFLKIGHLCFSEMDYKLCKDTITHNNCDKNQIIQYILFWHYKWLLLFILK